jgi:signal transduction histidine kinase
MDLAVSEIKIHGQHFFTGIVHDLSQTKKSERLAAMGQMLSVIAHESRNVLQRIQAGVDMLQFGIESDSQQMDDLNRIIRAKNDLTRLFEELRGYADPIQLDVSAVDLANVWRRA